MRFSWLALWMILLVLFIPMGVVYADDPAPGSPQDNACYEGGVLAGVCSTPQDWECGYSFARWEAAGGLSGRNSIAIGCESLLLPIIENIALGGYGSDETIFNPRPFQENACYEGGLMAGKCETVWEWECGAYLAAWQNNGGWNNPLNTFISWCTPEILLPPNPNSPTPNEIRPVFQAGFLVF